MEVKAHLLFCGNKCAKGAYKHKSSLLLVGIIPAFHLKKLKLEASHKINE
jgi:hypothetical protein